MFSKRFFNIKILSFIITTLWLIQSCASVGALKGSPKDITPPKLIEKKSTPNYQTFFKKQPILLTFDEWVKLEDAFTQIVVSPPLNERPEVVLDRKTLRFQFAKEEILRENATYTVNFGNAVKDLTESNPASNLRFVFSTGAVIDSLQIIGKVVDAVTGLPTEGVLLMLYDNLSDTVVKKIRPFYFSKTDKEGIAKIENVRAGTFKVFALKDNDLNYTFNQETEKIGFPLENLTLSATNAAPLKMDTAMLKNDTLRRLADSLAAANSGLKIRLFDPIKLLKITNKEVDKYGIAKIIFNQEVKNPQVTFDDIKQNAFTEISKDTLLIWYNQGDETAWNIYLKGEERNDTVRVRPRGKVDFMKKAKLSATNDIKIQTKNPTKPLFINFNYPIQTIDTQRFQLLDSAKKETPLSIFTDSTSKRKLYLKANFEEGKIYNLTILPSALSDIYGLKNVDTLVSKISVQSAKELGNVIMKLSSLDSTKSYVCQLLTGSGLVENEFFIDNKKSFDKTIEMLQPDQYSLKIIEDSNKNRKWDTGDYDKKLQPERIFTKQLEALRANWDVETGEIIVIFN
jgi:uncharacterized protein (DUF2141 family)